MKLLVLLLALLAAGIAAHRADVANGSNEPPRTVSATSTITAIEDDVEIVFETVFVDDPAPPLSSSASATVFATGIAMLEILSNSTGTQDDGPMRHQHNPCNLGYQQSHDLGHQNPCNLSNLFVYTDHAMYTSNQLNGSVIVQRDISTEINGACKYLAWVSREEHIVSTWYTHFQGKVSPIFQVDFPLDRFPPRKEPYRLDFSVTADMNKPLTGNGTVFEQWLPLWIQPVCEDELDGPSMRSHCKKHIQSILHTIEWPSIRENNLHNAPDSQPIDVPNFQNFADDIRLTWLLTLLDFVIKETHAEACTNDIRIQLLLWWETMAKMSIEEQRYDLNRFYWNTVYFPVKDADEDSDDYDEEMDKWHDRAFGPRSNWWISDQRIWQKLLDCADSN
jgi:hypothetical protein